MRRSTLVAVLVLGSSLWVAGAGEAQAQGLRRIFGGPRVFTGPGGPVNLTPGYGAGTTYAPQSYAGTTVHPSGPDAGYVKPYSYYVLPSPVPSRGYVEYGNDGFNFYGNPYGYPYDRWTWPYMGANRGILNRYYYPPLG